MYTIPFKTLDRVMAHQIPESPRGVITNKSAMGIRAEVRIMLMTEACMVFPRPERAPVVRISSHINIWDTPRT